MINKKTEFKWHHTKMKNIINEFRKEEAIIVTQMAVTEIKNELYKKLSSLDDLKVIRKMISNKNIVFSHTDKTCRMLILNGEQYRTATREIIHKIRVEDWKNGVNKILPKKVADLLSYGKWPEERAPITGILAKTHQLYLNV